MDDSHGVARPLVGSHSASRQGRRVLLLDTDLFHAIGGGQSVYGRIILGRPEDTFYYFREFEAPDATRPANAVALPLRRIYTASHDLLSSDLIGFVHDYAACRNFAASAAAAAPGIGFDVVDVPDYRPLGAFIRPAFRDEGVFVGQVALALHGTLSEAFRRGWPTGVDDSRFLATLRVREHLQFRAADIRYAISADYAEHWRRYAPLPVHLLDPLCIVAGKGELCMEALGEGPPDLAFVGRKEKWKGPDLFLDIAWCLDQASYARLILAGPDGPNRLGQGSDAILAAMAQRRGLAPEIPGALPRAEMDTLFASRTLLLLPSRHDTFNLTALEAVRAGCPTIVSARAGVARWLREHVGNNLDWMTVEVDCSRVSAMVVAGVLRDYDRHRAELADVVSRATLRADAESLRGLYASAGEQDLHARQRVIEIAAALSASILARPATEGKGSSPGRALVPLRRTMGTTLRGARQLMLSDPVRQRWKRLPYRVRAGAHAVRETVQTALAVARSGPTSPAARGAMQDFVRRRAGLSPRTFGQADHLRRLDELHRFIREAPERSLRDVTVKLCRLSEEIPAHLIDRATLFQVMAKLERRRGNDLIAATYLLRVMRWLGADRRGDLPYVAATLRSHGYTQEALAAEAMFGAEGPEAQERSLDLMRAAYERNRTKPDLPLSILEDRRGQVASRVAVIVSLYNAADKLPMLLASLAQQSLAQRAELEVVLVDSNSPSDERGAFRAFADAHPDLPIVYGRSAERETIQAAWNRGIKLSRAPYLAFLGADEGLHPDALRQLAAVLDTNPSADWVMADSLVTSVDRNGIYDQDIMPYDRTGYHQDLVYLETCYLSWVGGLYRRTIHDRFGWYDESFRAAGDTEFKNRILPHIRSVHVPRMLGVFNNYPEERTTQHPRAEIEDLRAWYLWRTEAGMHYAFARRPIEDAVRLLRVALNYRKSYCGHLSTDFDLADALARHIATRPDAPVWALTAPCETGAALAALRALEQAPPGSRPEVRPMALAWWGWQRLREVRALAERHAAIFGLDRLPYYDVFNDNRYEQHWWSWSTV